MINKTIVNLHLFLFRISPFAFLFNFLTWAVLGFLPMIMGLVVMSFTENLLDNNPKSQIMLIVLVVLYVSNVIMILIGGKFEALTTFRVMVKMKEMILIKLFSNSKTKENPAEILNIIENDVQPFTLLLSLEMDLILKLLQYLGSLIILFRASSIITVIVIIPILVIQFIINSMQSKINELNKKKRTAEINFTAQYTEVIKNKEAVKQLNCKGAILSSLDRSINILQKNTINANVFQQLLKSLNNLFYGISIVMLITIYKYSPLTISFSEIILFTTYLSFGYGFLGLYHELVELIQKLKIALFRLDEDLNLSISDLFTYKNEVLKQSNNRDPELIFNNGYEDIALTTGSIYNIENETLADLVLEELRGNPKLIKAKNIVETGFVQQESFLLNSSIKENICLGVVNDERFNKAIRCACIEALVNSKKDEPIGENGLKLSEGQRKRVCIARAIFHGKDLLLLKKPFNNIDFDNAKAIGHNIARMGMSKIVLYLADKHISTFTTND